MADSLPQAFAVDADSGEHAAPPPRFKCPAHGTFEGVRLFRTDGAYLCPKCLLAVYKRGGGYVLEEVDDGP